MALPADGLLTLSDLTIVGNVVSATASPALKEAVIGLNLVALQDCPPTTNVIKWRKLGSCIAEAVAETAAYTPSDANSDPADATAVTTTAVKYMVATPVSAEALRFGGGATSFELLGQEHGRALGRAFDDDLLSMFDGLTNAATATSTLDVDTLLNGQYQVYNALVPPGPLVAVLDFKGAYELKKLIANSGACQYANQSQIAILNSVPQANNFVGNFLGIDIYQTTGLSTTGNDDQGAIFDPRYCFCAGMGGAIQSAITFTAGGVANNWPAVSYMVTSWMFWDIGEWNDTAGCELRSDT